MYCSRITLIFALLFALPSVVECVSSFPNLLLGYISLISLPLHLLTYPIHSWSVQPRPSHPTQMHPVVTVKSWSILMIMHSSVMSVLNGTTYLVLMSEKSAIPSSWRTVVSSGFVRVAGLCSIVEAIVSSRKPVTENESLRKEIKQNSSEQLHLLEVLASKLPSSHDMYNEEASPERASPSLPVSTNATNPGELAPITPVQVSGLGNIPSCPTQKTEYWTQISSQKDPGSEFLVQALVAYV